MTIPYTPAKAVFVGNNVAVDFPFAFRVWDAHQLQVVITDPDDQSVTVTGWTVALTDNGGTVTFRKDGQPLPAGWKLAILRDMPFEQGVDLVNGTQFHPEVVETQMDVATAERQQLKEAVDRSIKVPPTNENPPELLADMLFEARDQTLASAAAAAASEQAAAGSAAEAAASAAEAAQTLTTATTVIGEAKADALDGIEAKRQAVMAEVTAEHGAALGDIATDRAAAQTAIADDRSAALSAIADLANESVTTITRTGQLQVNAVQAAGAAIVATGDDIVRAVNAAGAAQVAKVAGTGAKARQDVVLEGDAQVARVSATGAEYVRQTYEEAQNAKGEADRAEAAADKAVSLAEVDYASATNGGLCPKVGEGLKVITLPDGSKRIDAITQVIAVSTPELTFPADVAVGFEYSLAMSAGTLIPGGRVVGYEVTVDGGETVELVADAEGIGKAMVTPVGVDLTTGNIAVLAIDSEGNRSKIAYRTFTKHAVVVRAPHILSPLEGDADVALLAAFQIQSFDIYGMASTGVATRLQVARDAAFTDVVFDSGENSAYATSLAMVDRLPDGVTLYARARHKAEIYGWSDWGQTVSFATVAITLKAPRIIAPIAGAVDQPVNVAVVLSAIETTGIAATPANTRVIVARDADLTDRVFDSLETGAYSTSVPTTGLPVNTELFVSGQHRDAELGWSALAAVRPFRTLNAYIEAPTITAPTAADGVELRPIFTFSAFANIGPVDSHKLTRFQVARDALFGDLLVDAVVSSGDRTKYAMTQDLPLFTQLYARVKYEGNTWGESAWSAVYVFRTLNAFVEKPAITSPAAGATGVDLRPAFTATAFANQGPTDTAAGAHWQLSRNADFTDLVQEANGAYAATFTPSADLNIVTAYWARVKYRGVIWGESAWSDAVTFTTLNAFVEAPTVTAPANGATGAALKPTITLSAFSNAGPADTHGGTRIQIATDAGFSNVVAEHNGAAVTEWTPGANLALNTQHYVRALYTGVKWGYSAWSGVVGFVTTMATPVTPTVLVPAEGSTVDANVLEIRSSAFTVNPSSEVASFPHEKSKWRLWGPAPVAKSRAASSRIVDSGNGDDADYWITQNGRNEHWKGNPAVLYEYRIGDVLYWPDGSLQQGAVTPPPTAPDTSEPVPTEIVLLKEEETSGESKEVWRPKDFGYATKEIPKMLASVRPQLTASLNYLCPQFEYINGVACYCIYNSATIFLFAADDLRLVQSMKKPNDFIAEADADGVHGQFNQSFNSMTGKPNIVRRYRMKLNEAGTAFNKLPDLVIPHDISGTPFDFTAAGEDVVSTVIQRHLPLMITCMRTGSNPYSYFFCFFDGLKNEIIGHYTVTGVAHSPLHGGLVVNNRVILWNNSFNSKFVLVSIPLQGAHFSSGWDSLPLKDVNSLRLYTEGASLNYRIDPYDETSFIIMPSKTVPYTPDIGVTAKYAVIDATTMAVKKTGTFVGPTYETGCYISTAYRNGKFYAFECNTNVAPRTRRLFSGVEAETMTVEAFPPLVEGADIGNMAYVGNSFFYFEYSTTNMLPFTVLTGVTQGPYSTEVAHKPQGLDYSGFSPKQSFNLRG